MLVGEPTSPTVAETYAQDPEVVAWWATQVECASALARLEREGQLGGSDLSASLALLAGLTTAWHEVQPVPAVRQTAIRLLRWLERIVTRGVCSVARIPADEPSHAQKTVVVLCHERCNVDVGLVSLDLHRPLDRHSVRLRVWLTP